ncbi:MAG: 50S ribosomal protein L4, partial [Actinomycetota bacterium]|nr:50S ribosomal protein L4 [Actinomycetota bacterium]
MAQITIKNPAGKDAGKVDLDEALFGVQPNVPLMHQVVTAQLARRRAGTQSTKTRSEVRGGGAKPYRQKGTGNARQGSTNTPHYTGGGVAHGPKPRSYAQRTPKKMIKQALRSALSDRASDGKVLVVDAWGFDSPKTKHAANALAALGVDGRTLVVLERSDAMAALSFRNIPEVQIIQPGEMNAYDVLCNDWIVFTQSALSIVEDVASAGAAKAKAGAKVFKTTADTAEPAERPAKAAKAPAKAKKSEAAEAPESRAVRGFA